MYGMNLYTGKVGYVLINKLNYLYELFLGLIGNFIGKLYVVFYHFLNYLDNYAFS